MQNAHSSNLQPAPILHKLRCTLESIHSISLMSTPPEPLHTLIQSLSQAEKRYIKVFAGRHVIGDGNNYIALFDAMASQETYDESALLKALGDPTRHKNLASDKHYLKNLILRAMRAYNEERDMNAHLRNLLGDLQFLKGKQLYSLFWKAWTKAHKLASLHERLPVLLELLQLKREAIKEIGAPGMVEEIAAINVERAQVLARQQRLNEYLALYDVCYVIIRAEFRGRGPKLEEMLTAVEANPLFLNAEMADTFTARLDYHSIHAFVAQLRRRSQDAVMHFQSVCDVWETMPHEIAEDIGGYLKSLGNYLSACHQADLYDEFHATLTKIEAIVPTTLSMRADKFYTLNHYRLIHALNTGDFHASNTIAAAIEQGLSERNQHLAANRVLTICYNMAVLYFFQGDFSKALKWLNRIVNETESDSRQDIRQAARLLQLVVHVELGNFDLLSYLHTALQRYLRIHDRRFGLEEAVLGFVNEVQKLTAGESLSALAAALAGKLAQLKGTPEGAAAGLEEILYWAQSKAQGRPIQAVYLQALGK